MSSLDQRIYEWLPARRSKQRVTLPHIAALNLGVSIGELMPIWNEMLQKGHIWVTKSGYQQGRRLPDPTVPTLDPQLF